MVYYIHDNRVFDCAIMNVRLFPLVYKVYTHLTLDKQPIHIRSQTSSLAEIVWPVELSLHVPPRWARNLGLGVIA